MVNKPTGTIEEIASGVIVEKRRLLLLWLPALAAAGALFRTAGVSAAVTAPAKDTSAPAPRNTNLDWEDFLAASTPVAREMVGDRSPVGQDVYLLRIASMAMGLKGVPATRLSPFADLDPEVRFGLSHRGNPFFIVQWWMAPGAILPAHCHPETNVCTVGLEGEARVRHFEPRPGAPAYNSGSKEAFVMRQTRDQILTPGRVSTLSSTRDNIHYFRAGPEGARGIDITTAYGGDGSFSFIHFEPDRPVDRMKNLYEAVWIGSKLKKGMK